MIVSLVCGRYRRTTSEEELARRYHIAIPKQTDLPISYNIAPSQKILTIRLNPEAGRTLAGCASMGVNSTLVQRPENCVQNDQCAGRDRRFGALLSAGLQKATLSDPGGRLL
jgi:putative SOS response-associated peptidase YedK